MLSVQESNSLPKYVSTNDLKKKKRKNKKKLISNKVLLMEIPNNSIQYYNKRQKRQTPQTQTICIYSFFQLSHIPSENFNPFCIYLFKSVNM
jgi:hypothetical protein